MRTLLKFILTISAMQCFTSSAFAITQSGGIYCASARSLQYEACREYVNKCTNPMTGQVGDLMSWQTKRCEALEEKCTTAMIVADILCD